ncbi:DUF7282 domain-containing protein [Salegentibacter chungangensis]|uniref:DUF7282 domain-containing protein n=1 Tax=Salegentibacter chungangensis TaxID=1335724 RepID=A0ABW3NVV2_9FLAO
MKFKKNYFLIMFLSFAALGLTSCSEDDDDMVEVMDPTGSLTVADQTVENNMLTISDVEMSADGWVVIHRAAESGGPMVPDIISEPKMVEAGTSSDVMVELKDGVEIEDGETLWAMLHTDNGEIGMYEFDGSNGLDAPILTAGGDVVTQSFSVMEKATGSLMVEDQAVTDNMVTISSVTLNKSGYVVIHADNGEGAPVVPDIISEPVYLEAGTHTDVDVMFTENADVEAGDTLWAMLHTDTGEEEVYEFDGENGLDGPITDMNGDVVLASFSITENDAAAGSLTVDDQVLTNNNVTVGAITLEEDGYVVIHADNGDGAPVVPDIISQAVYLEAGTYTNVEVPLKESADVNMNDTVWVMLHTDTGTEGEYEFDGQNGLDGPITDAEGNIVMESLVITDVSTSAITGSITIDNQAVSDNMITAESITVAEDGWVVVHADNGDGAPVVPEIISNPVYLEAGTNNDVEISFEESADVNAGDTVWVMLHNDTGAAGEYEFDGMNGLDLPIVVDGNVVVTPIDITE